MELAELVEACGGQLAGRAMPAVRVCDITEDSRTVLPGSMFVARKGLTSDGRKFVEQAIESGAVAILTDDRTIARTAPVPVVIVKDVALGTALAAEHFYGHPSRKLKVIAVTGTNGKTTTTYLAWQILNAAGFRCGLMGTVEIDDGVTVAPAAMTTPPAIEISRSLGVMTDNRCRAVVLEASSHALDQKRVDGLKIDVGVFTNLTGDHLDYHKTMENYGAAKARLFAMLGPGGLAVVNSDDAAHARMVKGCAARVVKCTARAAAGCEASAEAVAPSIEGMKLRLRGPWGRAVAETSLIGPHNVMNTLQALCACHAVMGDRLTPEVIETVLPTLKAPPGRLERVKPHGARTPSRVKRPLVFVDFAHSDDALRNVLRSVREAMGGAKKRGELWAVFGCGGDKDRTKRPRMGLAAAELADRVVVTSDNPRSEKPGAIVDEILAGIPTALKSKVEVQVERLPAIRHAITHAAPGDVVVLAGKGHETEQILTDERGQPVRIHFDDREVAAKILAERSGRAKHARAHA